MLKKLSLGAMLLLLAAASGCGGSYTPKPPEEVSFLDRAETQSRNGLTVTVAVLSREESKEVFGVDLSANGIQSVWLDIENKTGKPYVFMPIALDPGYFSPNEVAFMNHFKFNSSANREMDEQFSKYGIQVEYIMPGERDKGFVYTNLDPGLKFVNVTLYQIDGTENFFFYFEVPGIQPDYENVDFAALYKKDEIVHIDDEDGLRKALEELPCCTTGAEGGGGGEPINVVLIGDPDDISSAIVRRKWDVTEAETKKFNLDLGRAFSPEGYRTFPMASLYVFGRRQDVGFQKSRRETDAAYRQRNTLRLWLTPLRYKGKTVWAGAVSRDIGSDLRIRKYWFAAQEIDPDIDETRDFIVEDLVISQSVQKLGYVTGVGQSTPENPAYNLNKLPWWSDGYRAVLLFGNDQTTLGDMEYFDWENVEDINNGERGEGGSGNGDSEETEKGDKHE